VVKLKTLMVEKEYTTEQTLSTRCSHMSPRLITLMQFTHSRKKMLSSWQIWAIIPSDLECFGQELSLKKGSITRHTLMRSRKLSISLLSTVSSHFLICIKMCGVESSVVRVSQTGLLKIHITAPKLLLSHGL
jgi:hypothetical protein